MAVTQPRFLAESAAIPDFAQEQAIRTEAAGRRCEADTLWMQALLPPEDAKEIASSRLFIAHQIATRYQPQYDAAFGAKYTLPVADLAAMPALRGVSATAPYGHGGTLSTLQLVTHQYGIRGLDHADPSSIGTTEQWVPMFDANAQSESSPHS